jgi:hypothetical protein
LIAGTQILLLLTQRASAMPADRRAQGSTRHSGAVYYQGDQPVPEAYRPITGG